MPQTNNCTERTIGRSKACAGLRSGIRYKTVRGYKSEEGMMNGFLTDTVDMERSGWT